MRFWIKLAFVFAMTLAILVPLALIDGVIDDRQRNRAEAVEQISATFAAAQVFGGPVLVIPYTESVEVDVANADGSTRAAALTLGKRISNQLYLSYETGLAGAMGTVSMFYDLSRRVTVRARAGEENAIDLIFTTAYD